MDSQDWNRGAFKAALHAMCQPADIQLSLYPDGCAKADELANDFTYRWDIYGHDFKDELTTEQIQAVNAVDCALDAKSDPSRTDLWTDEAVASGNEWKEIRDLAGVALRLFGWSESVPDKQWF